MAAMSDNALVYMRLAIGHNSLDVSVPAHQVSALIDRWFDAVVGNPAELQLEIERLKQSASTLQSAVDANTPKPTKE
jgi:hypothetical protein